MPSPPPLRTVQAPFNAYGSSLRQRAFSKHAVGPIGLGVHLGVNTAVPATELIGGGGRTSEDRDDPADSSALPPAPVG